MTWGFKPTSPKKWVKDQKTRRWSLAGRTFITEDGSQGYILHLVDKYGESLETNLLHQANALAPPTRKVAKSTAHLERYKSVFKPHRCIQVQMWDSCHSNLAPIV